MELTGGFLTVTAFFLYGVSKVHKEKDALGVLEGMLTLLRELSARLLHRREGLRQVFATYGDPRLEACGFLPALREHDGRDYPSLWNAALRLLPLPAEALPPLQSLGSSLGRVSLTVQTEQLALSISQLETILRKMRDSAYQKGRSTVALWTLGGLLVALLLL